MAVVRFTKQRQAVLEAVRNTDTHPDAAWVYAEVRKVLPNISLGTVYRSLEALVQEGHLMTIQSAGEATRYDARTEEDHYHLVCRGCGRIFDTHLRDVPDFRALLARMPQGFSIDDVLLEFHGTCEDCRRQ
ncbi:Fur family ferric uptake transcriptional regulator [Deinobacterium chartae]|uniref:Fur family ferric uptake transcriptional regulator n=1 Tax=Deinobacterium chartae TaxID=521158 RepID=A0A841I3I7_9DEIO|nr:transcriptional repressor [Deinobacterium chartae]MBB6098938.1 Fur family ferric uptake transcriptional regulator [Deinobacterium chartae]